MSVILSLQIAIRALRVTPMRSLLTMLGIVIGVASIVNVLAIGRGAQMKIEDQMRSIGANVLLINPGAAREGAVRLKAGTKLTLTEGDVQAIIEQIPEVRAAAGSLAGTAQVIQGSKNWNTTINGTTASQFLVRDWDLSSGRYFSEGEETGASKVAILGSIPAQELFGNANPVGAQIRVLNVPLQVIGVLNAKGAGQDDVIFVPLSTAKLRFLGGASGVNRDTVAFILVKASMPELMGPAKSEIEKLLRQRHRIPNGQDDDFKVQDPAAAMEAQQGAIHTVALLLMAIALVSLLVGGISIMNIMIVAVTERTREIGIRRALGGRMRDIRMQFLWEALLLCIIGGGLGVAAGIVTSLTVARMAGWVTAIDLSAIVLSIGFSVITGMVFGLYPAYRASRLNPIEALKTE